MPAPLDLPNREFAASSRERTARKWRPTPSYCCVVDRWGNAFSATPSDGSGNVPVVPGLGITPSGLRLAKPPRSESTPPASRSGKRPRLTPNPAMLLTEDGGVMPFGTPGGDVQTQAMLQVMLNIMHFGMDPQSAIEAPRVCVLFVPVVVRAVPSISPAGSRWKAASIRQRRTNSPRAAMIFRTGRSGPGSPVRSRRS